MKIDKPRPVVLHTGERVLNRKQTLALDKLLKAGKVSLPKGGRKPKPISRTEVKKVYAMLINNTKRGKKKN